MESKKINQLATNVAPVSTDLTIIGDPITGVSKKITLLQLASIFSGSIAFYTNYAAFPATGTVNTIYCAKDTNKLYLWSGSAYVETFPSQALLDTYQLRSEKGVSNGYASLDSAGKVPISQLPSSIMEYKGMWSATTNTPTLANGTGDTGDVYICNGAGSVNFGAGAITFAVGDYVVYSGTIWQRSSGAVGTVTSVGLSTNGNSITIGSSPISTSGTITANFAGTSLQYINGAGNLVTFPTLLSSDNLVAVVRNQSGATMTAGTVVYISGATGNKPLISKALATGDSTSAQTYGFVQSDITNNADGYVVVIGNVNDLNTSALTEGQQLYLSGTTAGTYTTTKPYAPIHLVYVGIVLRSHPTQGIIGVKIQNGFEMDELHNVDAYLPNNNDILSYNTTTSLWEHKQIATTLGFTPISLASLSATSPIFYNSTTGVISSQAASSTLNGYLTSSDWTTFNGKIGGSGTTNYLPKFTGASTLGNSSISDGVITGEVNIGANLTTTGASRVQNGFYVGYANAGALALYTLIYGATNGIQIVLANNTGGAGFIFQTANSYNYTFPAASGTIALVGGSGVGTVTSVAALTLGTTGTDLSSTVANGTTTPVITLNVPTASATNRGALSSADWTTFNGKQSALTNPVTGTGTTNYISKFTGTSTIGNSLIWDNGTNVGIGNTNTSYTLDVSGTGRFTSTLLVSGAATLSTSLVIGSTDSTWNLASSNKLQIQNSMLVGAGTTATFLTMNLNYNSGFKYISNGFASIYSQDSGDHTFYTSTSGTAAGAATLNERLRITNAGNVGIGVTPVAKFMVNVATNQDIRFSQEGSQACISSINDAASAFQVLKVDGSTLQLNSQSGGDVLVNSTSTSSGAKFNVFFSDATHNGQVIRETTGNASVTYLIFNSNGTQTGSISRVGSTAAVLYNTSSDYRLKEDLQEIKGLEKIAKIKVYDFKWKGTEERMDGVLAHELQEILPYAVSGKKDEIEKDETIKSQGVDYSKIVPILVKAIQELSAQVQEQNQTIQELSNRLIKLENK